MSWGRIDDEPLNFSFLDFERVTPFHLTKESSTKIENMAYKDVTPPTGGKITIKDGKLTVPENPILPFIRGDGTGPDIWAASVRVFDAAVQKAYGGKRKISWFEVFAGEESFKKFNN